MPKKIENSKTSIRTVYTDYLMTHGTPPPNIYVFCKNIGLTEAQFYQHFRSFGQIERGIFDELFDVTLQMLERSPDYANYDSKTKLLSFYYTIFEQFTANRSLITFLLEKEKPMLQNLRILKNFREKFLNYIKSLEIKGLAIEQERIEKLQQKGIGEASWIQFLLTLKFWREDDSFAFEKTDIFIEKAVHASFELLEMTPLKNILDFGKFVWKEKISQYRG